MTARIECLRCGSEQPRMDRAPYPGELGQRILDATCKDCWNEWREMEVRVINELRLNFIEPEAQATLVRHLVEFLGLPAEPGSSGVDSPCPELDASSRTDPE